MRTNQKCMGTHQKRMVINQKCMGTNQKCTGANQKRMGINHQPDATEARAIYICRVAKQLSSCRECRSPTACLHQRYGSISWIRASKHMVGPARLGLPAVADNASYSGQPVISNTLGPNGIWSCEHSLLTTGSPRETEGRFIIPPAPEAMILDGSSRTTAMFSHHMHVAGEAGERALAVSSVNRV